MKTLTREDLHQLLQPEDSHCISIYLPTHRKGMEVNEHQDQITFKEFISRAQQKLGAYNLSEREEKELLAPLNKLMNDSTFWHHLEDTLVVFRSDRQFVYYLLPYTIEPHLEVSNEFYVLPLIPLLNEDIRYYLMMLSMEAVRLFDVTPFHLHEINTESLTPDNFLQVAGSDYEDKTLQYRSQSREKGSFTTFGHGEGKDDREVEREQFFHFVDKGINKLLPDEKVPLVLATVEENFGEYKRVNHYKYLYEKPVKGNPELEKPEQLSRKGWQLLAPYFNNKLHQTVERFKETMDRDKTDDMVANILPASVNGKVEVLFVNKAAKAYGRYDAENNEVTMHTVPRLADADLMNLAARKTFEQKGKVYWLSDKAMPVPGTALNALYRY